MAIENNFSVTTSAEDPLAWVDPLAESIGQRAFDMTVGLATEHPLWFVGALLVIGILYGAKHGPQRYAFFGAKTIDIGGPQIG